MQDATFPIAFIFGPSKHWALWPVVIIRRIDFGHEYIINFLGGEIGFLYLNLRGRKEIDK